MAPFDYGGGTATLREPASRSTRRSRETTLEKMSSLQPAFITDVCRNGRHSSQIVDGSAASDRVGAEGRAGLDPAPAFLGRLARRDRT